MESRIDRVLARDRLSSLSGNTDRLLPRSNVFSGVVRLSSSYASIATQLRFLKKEGHSNKDILQYVAGQMVQVGIISRDSGFRTNMMGDREGAVIWYAGQKKYEDKD